MDCINTEATDVNLRMCPVIRYSDIRSHSHNSSFTSWAKVDRETPLQHQMAGSPSRFVLCPVIFQQQPAIPGGETSTQGNTEGMRFINMNYGDKGKKSISM